MSFRPLREFARLFAGNLTPGQQAEFQRMLLELEQTQEVTSLNTTLDYVRKKPDQRMPVPQVEVRSMLRGAILEWEPLGDQRIASFEVDVSNTANFASFTTIKTFGFQVAIDGLTTLTFARVRGVRNDGTTGPYSDVITISPEVFTLNTHQDEVFYLPIKDEDTLTVLGGSGSTLSYEPINEDGFSMTFGMLDFYADPDVTVAGNTDIKMRLYGKVVETGAETEYWRNSVEGFFGSYSVGPVAIPHPDSGQNLEIRLDVEDAFYFSEVLWGHLTSLELGSRVSEGAFYVGSGTQEF